MFKTIVAPCKVKNLNSKKLEVKKLKSKKIKVEEFNVKKYLRIPSTFTPPNPPKEVLGLVHPTCLQASVLVQRKYYQLGTNGWWQAIRIACDASRKTIIALSICLSTKILAAFKAAPSTASETDFFFMSLERCSSQESPNGVQKSRIKEITSWHSCEAPASVISSSVLS